MTLEDETGCANLVVRPRVHERCREGALSAPFILAEGHVERQGEVIHLVVCEIRRLRAEELEGLAQASRDFR
jgi:error-prone DNA polymerase